MNFKFYFHNGVCTMNRIILIGNGFDLAHGLKTGYKDFIDDFWVREKGDAYIGLIKSRRSSFYSYIDDFIKIESPCNYESLLNTIDNNEDGYEWFKALSKSKSNIWVDSEIINLKVTLNSFLQTISEKIVIEKWVDVEEEYYLTLKNCIEENKLNDILLLNREFSKVQEVLEEYLKIQSSYSIKKNPIIEQKIYSPVSLSFFKKETDEIENVLFLNFNYTNTEKLYLSKKYSFHTIHIHGELNNPDNPVIFGYGDEIDEKYKLIEQINDNRYLQNIKSIKYLETRNYSKLLAFIDSDPFEIFIMGHSCGISDRTLLNTLFEHENCVAIKVFFHKKPDGTDNYSDLTRNISRNFIDKPLMRKRVINKKDSQPLLD